MQLGSTLYQAFIEWRIQLFDHLEHIETDYLRVIAGDLRHTAKRIEEELERRAALKAVAHPPDLG